MPKKERKLKPGPEMIQGLPSKDYFEHAKGEHEQEIYKTFLAFSF